MAYRTEILADLAKIADPKVISRTSVLPYKAGNPRNLREIAQQPGVARALEGSAQRLRGKVGVNATLSRSLLAMTLVTAATKISSLAGGTRNGL